MQEEDPQIEYNKQLKSIYFHYGDKFTKRPIQHGRHLILLGRMHLFTFDVVSFESKMLQFYGEDYAEKQGQYLKKVSQEDQEIS